MAMARIGATGRGGVDRQALTPEDAEARSLLAEWATTRGFGVFLDEAGNLFVRREGSDPSAPAILSGSHLDTQPAGGNFDGVFGVLGAFETLEALEDAGIGHRRSIEAVVWTNEEGCRFAPGCTGSLVFSGQHDIEDLWEAVAPDGAVMKDELERTLASLPSAARRGGSAVAGYVEAHIEQGPRLEEEGLTVGVVTGIQGSASFEVTVTGEEGHAGTVPLAARRDAFRSAHAVIDALQRELADPEDTVRFTVGRFGVWPGSPNTIPGKASFTIDLRHPDAACLRWAVDRVAELSALHAGPCDVAVACRDCALPVDFDPGVVERIGRVAGELGIPAMPMASGAYHDARNLAPLCPTGMIFVPCERGISHNEAESARAEDLAEGTRVLADVLCEMARV